MQCIFFCQWFTCEANCSSGAQRKLIPHNCEGKAACAGASVVCWALPLDSAQGIFFQCYILLYTVLLYTYIKTIVSVRHNLKFYQ